MPSLGVRSPCLHVIYLHDYRLGDLSNITQKVNSLQLGQIIQFKGMLIGIYKSREFFHTKHFGFYSISNQTEDKKQTTNGK